MIYITGDIHAEFDRIMYLAKKMNKDDILIVAGDFGIWNNSPREQYYFKNISKLDITVLFVDGNHENFDMLNSFEIKEWNGGKIHEIKPNIIHLMRGQIYNINNYSILTFGGGKSHDIQDGILDPKDPDFKIKKRRLKKQGKYMWRVKNQTWWPEEMPSDEEYEECLKNLEKCNYKVDYIITHCGPKSVVQMGTGINDSDKLTDFFETINSKIDYKHWYFGHYHKDTEITRKHTLVFENMKELIKHET